MSISIYLDQDQQSELARDYSSQSGSLHIKHRPSQLLDAEYTHSRYVYKQELGIFKGSSVVGFQEKPFLVLRGRIVHSVIQSILENSNEAHLKLIINGCKSFLELRENERKGQETDDALFKELENG